MKWLFILLFITQVCFGQDQKSIDPSDPFIYRGQKRSLIQWKDLDSKLWLDYRSWLVESTYRDQNPQWKMELRDILLSELVGKVLSCIGTCKVYRGKAYVNASYRSKIYEGDEVQTTENSYAWIFLMDGTLVRISPNSSISFKEINVSNDETFYHVRMNSGYFTWLARLPFELQEHNLAETDPLFLPLAMKEANRIHYEHLDHQNQTESKLLAAVTGEDKRNLKQYEKLNSLIVENDKLLAKKPSVLFLVLPNGTIYGQNLQLEVLYELGKKAYIKLKDPVETYKIDEVADEVKQRAEFFYRGYANLESKDLSVGHWYEINEKGKSIREFDEGDKVFHLSELLTKRIPSMMMAREYWVKQNSLPLLKNGIEKNTLASSMGYRLWSLRKNTDDSGMPELFERIEFLKEYTRRIETTHLNVVEKLVEKHRQEKTLEEKGKDNSLLVEQPILASEFYQKAFDAYTHQISNRYDPKMDEALELNRLGYHFWLMVNAKGNK